MYKVQTKRGGEKKKNEEKRPRPCLCPGRNLINGTCAAFVSFMPRVFILLGLCLIKSDDDSGRQGHVANEATG